MIETGDAIEEGIDCYCNSGIFADRISLCMYNLINYNITNEPSKHQLLVTYNINVIIFYSTIQRGYHVAVRLHRWVGNRNIDVILMITVNWCLLETEFAKAAYPRGNLSTKVRRKPNECEYSRAWKNKIQAEALLITLTMFILRRRYRGHLLTVTNGTVPDV